MIDMRALWDDESGAVLSEYAVLLALLSLLSITSLQVISAAAETTLETAYKSFQALQETPPL